ncbi:MAG: DUF3823 domain-containing protein [Chitinophagaceae bacterium]|nr:DUF3823 domain-containing protein [Chitinophagaceae bacterium]
MKKLFYTYCIGLSLIGCKVDNYEGPNAVITGSIVDNETGEPVASGGSVSGTVVRFYQNNAAQPLNFTTFPDGTFTNKASFTGNYTYTAEGPFILVNSAPQSIVVKTQTDVKIPVTPNIRLTIEKLTSGGTTATYKVTYHKLNNDQDMIEIGISWATYKNPNRIVYAGGKNLLEDVAGQNLITGTREYELTGLEAGNTYYLRAFARTNNPGSYYNYSQQAELPVP